MVASVGADPRVCHAQVVLACHALLWLLEHLPLLFILIGMLSHAAYYMLLRTFPVLTYTSVEFILSGGAWRVVCCAAPPLAVSLVAVRHLTRHAWVPPRSWPGVVPCRVAVVLHVTRLLPCRPQDGTLRACQAVDAWFLCGGA